mmetsp:Transcript_111808/g.198046  ORF Transcript_111808/g.198046 Transcript_111808/m.198046 type:complete len:345 (+) Transcript_111808:1-1035(+)
MSTIGMSTTTGAVSFSTTGATANPTLTPLISSAGKAESAVQVGPSYLVSDMDGTVKMYKADGSLDNSFTPISSLANPRGLAVNSAGTKLWVAHDGGVSEYSLTASGATRDRTYDLTLFQIDKPNGLCLNEDESKLFVTQPGWKAFPYGADGVNALVMLTVGSMQTVVLFRDRAGHTPNGCVVKGMTIWMMNQKDGLTSFRYDNNQHILTYDFAAAVKTYQQDNQEVGDGIVFYEDKWYLSSWKPMPAQGAIHVCDPWNTATPCTEYSTEVACDMQLGGTVWDPVLLLPSIMGQSVKILSLPAPANPPPSPTTTPAVPQATDQNADCAFLPYTLMLPLLCLFKHV